MPPMDLFVSKACSSNAKAWKGFNKKMFATLNEFIDVDVGRMLHAIPNDTAVSILL